MSKSIAGVRDRTWPRSGRCSSLRPRRLRRRPRGPPAEIALAAGHGPGQRRPTCSGACTAPRARPKPPTPRPSSAA